MKGATVTELLLVSLNPYTWEFDPKPDQNSTRCASFAFSGFDSVFDSVLKNST